MQFQQALAVILVFAAHYSVITAVKEGCAKDIVFLADISGSVSAEKEIGQLKGFMKDLVGRFKIDNFGGSNVALVTFETTAAKVLDLNGNKDDISRSIDSIQATSGWTDYIGALEIAKDILMFRDRDDSSYPDVVVMLTDGKPTRTRDDIGVPDNSNSPSDVRLRRQMHEDILSMCGDLVRNGQVTIITIAISDETNTTLLNLMSSDKSFKKETKDQDTGFSVTVTDFDALVNLPDYKKEEIVRLMCDEGREIIPTDGPDCFDVTFLVDISGSVSNLPGDKISTIKQYLHTIVDNINIGSSQTRMSIITFERRATKIVGFQNSKQDVQNAINGISSTSGWTNYFEAFSLANQIYGNSMDRSDDRNPDMVVLLTDGKPTVTRNDVTLSENDFSVQANRTREQMHIDILNEVRSLRTHSSFGIPLTVSCQAIGNEVNKTLLELIDPSFGRDLSLKVQPTNYQEFYTKAQTYAMAVVNQMRNSCPRIALELVDCLDITLVMDMSGSIMYVHDEGVAKRELGDAFRSVMNRYPDQMYSLVEFSDDVEVVFELSRQTESGVRSEINAKVNKGGWTATAKAFQVVRNQVYRGFSSDRSRGQNLVFILTDGHPTRSLNLTRIRETESRERRRYIEDEAINEARQLVSQDNALIGAVLVDGQHNKNRDFLQQVVSRSDFLETVDNFDQAGSAINRILDRMPLVKTDNCS